MQQIALQCTSCGAFTRRSLHYEEEYQSSVLLERLRTSNFPATDKEISHIRHTILPTVSDDISSIESQLVSLREAITSMEEERGRLINVQKKYNNLVSLHRTLPLEIWSEIFLYTVLSSASASNAFDASGSIWKLSHVCQRWRNVALSLHSCWSTMDLHFPKAAHHEGDVQRLETVIQRSRQGPLDVTLKSGYSPAPSPDPSILKRILDIVLAESYRWRKLHLSDYRGNLNMLYTPLHNRLPFLQCLSLDRVQIEPKEQSVFKDCPRLTKLTLGESPPVVEFPWDQITELDLSGMDVKGDEDDLRACVRLIRLCTSLETLSVPYWYLEADEAESPYTPTTCSNVRKLDTKSVHVIDALTLPCLREASLHPNPVMVHHDALYSFKRLLIRSSCLGALTGLSLAGVPLAASSDRTLLSLLSQTHSLVFLDLDVCMQEFDDQTSVNNREQIVAIVESLKVIQTRTVTFLPLLSSLDIRIRNHQSALSLLYFGPVGSLASAVEARWKGDDTVGLARLKTCHFSVQAQYLMQNRIYRDALGPVAGIFNEAESSIFNALVDDGMDLAIRVTSCLTENVGGNNVVFAVPS
ncbi:hypothetical protein BDZ89DRAFT_156662 [Hymenopellis radicata]|nr:hypothetical protein BDZ89DRAFT_156662 [Hymenopellis radicata]